MTARKFILSTLVLLWLALTVVGAARAHAELVAAEPAPGATVSSPAEIRLTFSEPLYPGSTFMLFAPGFQLMAGITPQIEDRVLRAALVEPLSSGTYTVQWTAVTGDGHAVEGSYQFAVADPSANFGWIAWGGAALAVIAGIGVAVRRRKRSPSAK